MLIFGTDNEAVVVDGKDANANGYLDLGEHEIGPLFRVRISDPEAGVMISGILLRPVDADHPASLDTAEEERLRALGYLE